MRRSRAGRLTPLACALISACQPGQPECKGRWSSGPPLPEPVQDLHAAVLRGRIYLIGGGPRAGAAQTDVVEVFTP